MSYVDPLNCGKFGQALRLSLDYLPYRHKMAAMCSAARGQVLKKSGVEEEWSSVGYKRVLRSSLRSGPVSMETMVRFEGWIWTAVEAHRKIRHVIFEFGLWRTLCSGLIFELVYKPKT